MGQAARLDLLNQPIDLRRGQRFDDFSAGADALADGEPILVRRQRLGANDAQGVQIRAVLPADQEHVAEPARGNERDPACAGAAEATSRVGGDGGAVDDLGSSAMHAGAPDGVDHRQVKVRRGGGDLDDVNGGAVGGDQIGKRAADVDADAGVDCLAWNLKSSWGSWLLSDPGNSSNPLRITILYLLVLITRYFAQRPQRAQRKQSVFSLCSLYPLRSLRDPDCGAQRSFGAFVAKYSGERPPGGFVCDASRAYISRRHRRFFTTKARRHEGTRRRFFVLKSVVLTLRSRRLGETPKSRSDSHAPRGTCQNSRISRRILHAALCTDLCVVRRTHTILANAALHPFPTLSRCPWSAASASLLLTGMLLCNFVSPRHVKRAGHHRAAGGRRRYAGGFPR